MLCYRFCEDNSQEMINLQNNCPENTICKNQFENSQSMISYDDCGIQGLGHVN